ncbi:MAG: TolC family protein [Chitinophagaceae bacterium]|nr:TolC family protein [Chitinophagaceae bacterium]
MVLAFAFNSTATAQQKWNLMQCVQYAMDNNIVIKQNALQTNLSELQLKQSKMGQYPNANLNNNYGLSFGRRENPATGILVDNTFFNIGLNVQTSADIFNWFSKKNTIAANSWEVEAAKASNDKLKNDIALAVANAYLQILLAREQEKIADVQLQQSKAQLLNTRKLVNAGSLPELNAAELEAQVARDSANYISAKGNVEQGLLSLKANMGFDAATAFDIDTPPADKIFVEKISDLQPEAVYASAMANMPQQRYNVFKLKAAEKTTAAAKGSMYPSLSAFGSLATSYVKPSGFDAPKILREFNTNFGQSIGLGVSVPIFNGSNAKSAWQRSKLTIKNLQFQKDLDNQKLKQDIYQAYNAAVVALEKYNASKKGVETAERSYNFANKRYEIGMLTTLELLTNQNNLFRSKLEYSLNQFDYVFKMKVLEFYKGLGLKF